MRTITAFVALALIVFFSVPGMAHHSLAATYNLDQTAEIDGRVVLVALRQPHSFIHIEARDTAGITRRWSAEWDDAVELVRRGIAYGDVRPGDRIRIIGHPGRNRQAYQLLITNIIRPSDGWTWSESR